MDIGHIKGIGRATFIYKDYNITTTFRVYPLYTTVVGICSIASSCFKGLIVLSITCLIFNIQFIKRECRGERAGHY
jgi:hypothetical protein